MAGISISGAGGAGGGLSQATADNRYAGFPQWAAGSRLTASKPKPTWVTTFNAGHGWGSSGTGATISLNDTTTGGALCGQCVTFTTNGLGNGVTISSPTMAAIDLTSKSLCFLVRTTDITKWNFVAVYAGDATYTNYYTWSVSKVTAGNAVNPPVVANGEWALITLPFADASTVGTPTRASITNMKFFTTDLSTGALTVNLGGIGTVPEAGTTYPNGAVILSLDDSAQSQWTIAYPLMSSLGQRGTLFPIISNIGQAGSKTLAQVQFMHDFGGFEVGCHASTTAAHTTGAIASAAAGTLVAEIVTCQQWNIANGFEADSFAYPNGWYDAASAATVRSYFTSARGTYPKYETVPFPARDRVRAFSTAASINSLAALQAIVDKVKANHSIAEFVTHDILTTASLSTDTTTATFTGLCNYLNSQGVPVITQREAARAVTP